MSDTNTLSDAVTIVAIATPPGRGGIGVVRLSGSESLRIASELFPGIRSEPRVAHYRVLHDELGKRVDDALLIHFPAGGSYTGEDVVEISTHGSPVVQDWLVRACVRHGAAPARPGEFTQRAFLHGQLDLTGAEAVRDLIEAQTLDQARMAAEQMGGSIAATVLPVKQSLLNLIASLEAGIDFAEDDVDTVSADDLARHLQSLEPPLAALLASFEHGRLLRDGLRLAIVGEPNVGKSSLFNCLVEQERAIVTAMPGTTRDVITEHIALGGIPVTVLDTAGLRETEDEAERIGVVRSRQTMAEADAVLLVVDAGMPDGTAAINDLYGSLRGRPVIVACNKMDLLASCTGKRVRTPDAADIAVHDSATGTSIMPAAKWEPPSVAHLSNVRSANHVFPDLREEAAAIDVPTSWPTVRTSAVTGYGIRELREALLTLIQGNAQNTGSATLTNLRQRDTVSRAYAALQRAASAAASTPHEMILLDLYEALHALDELTGETTRDDILNMIFSTFCIGK